MLVITLYSNEKILMYEFKTEQEARDLLKDIKGNKILSAIIYYNDPCFFKALLNFVVDFRCKHSLSAGGPGASSARAPVGSPFDTLLPQESHAFHSNQQSAKNQH